MEHRVTKLETQVEHLEDKTDQLIKRVEELTLALAKYQGAWGAVLMIGGAIAAAFKLYKSDLF